MKSALLTCVLLGVSASTYSQTAENRTSVESNRDRPVVYQRWLNEDVRWIINPDEKAAFLRLSSNSQRDEFVKQFWLRRDPTPGTEENEFKEEHYRRIAYANEHFASTSPGWETDRRRIYIVYGPPDKIDSGVSRDSFSPHGVQIWYYRAAQDHDQKQVFRFVFRFIDSCDCGGYQLDTHPHD